MRALAPSAGKYYPNVEDLDNWHGKPLGKQSAAALEAVGKLITQPGPHGLTPLPFKDDAPKIAFPQVTLSSPPDYEMGKKVSRERGRDSMREERGERMREGE